MSIYLQHVFFADHFILFGETTLHQASILKRCLNLFCSILGHKVNHTQSCIYVFFNIPKHAALENANTCGFSFIDRKMSRSRGVCIYIYIFYEGLVYPPLVTQIINCSFGKQNQIMVVVMQSPRNKIMVPISWKASPLVFHKVNTDGTIKGSDLWAYIFQCCSPRSGPKMEM